MPPEGNVDDVTPATQAENRLTCGVGRFDQGDFESIAGRIGGTATGQRLLPIIGRIDIGTAWDDQAVEQGECFGNGFGLLPVISGKGQNDRQAARLQDRVLEHGRGHVDRIGFCKNGGIRNGVCGDRDDGAHGGHLPFSVNYPQFTELTSQKSGVTPRTFSIGCHSLRRPGVLPFLDEISE